MGAGSLAAQDMTHAFGRVQLPLHLNWSAPGRVFDLGSRADRACTRSCSRRWSQRAARSGRHAAVADRSYQPAEAALHRLETGTYGICERCGQPIGDERLAARPAAVTCIRCAAKGSR